MNKFTTLILIAAVALLQSCTTGYKIHKVRQGMTKPEVEDILGAPDSITANINRYKYLNRRTSDFSNSIADYYVDFDKDHRVWEYGSWNLRNRPPVAPQPAAYQAPNQPTSTQCTTYNNGIGQLQTNCDSQ